MQKLAFIIRDLGYGGAQRQLVTLAASLDRREFDVTVIHFYGGALESRLREAGVETVCVGKTHRWDLGGFFFRLVRIVRSIRPDILHGYLTESNVMTVCLKPFCPGAQIVWGLRDSQTDAHLWGILGRLSFRLARLVSRHADLIIANSRCGREYYSRLGYPKSKMAVVANGIDTARFRPDPVGRNQMRRELGIGEGDILFGLIGRLHAKKDHPMFLRAAAQLAARQPHVRFVCVGDGPADYFAELHRLAAELGIADKVIWNGARPDMPPLYNALDALVSSSAFGEGFSNVIGEAMACGTPCIATNVGDSALVIGRPEFCVPAGDSAALAAAMTRFAELTPEELSALKKQARSRIEDHFTVATMIGNTRELLLDLATAGAAPRGTQPKPSLA